MTPAECWPLVAGLSAESRTTPLLHREIRDREALTGTVPTDDAGNPDSEAYNAMLRRFGGAVVTPDE